MYVVICWLILFCQGYAQTPTNDQDARARELYKNGTVLYKEGSYKEAVLAFQEAYRLSKRHALLYNIAKSQEKMQNFNAAIESLQTYRIYAPNQEQATLRQHIDILRDKKRKQDDQKQRATQAPKAPPSPLQETAKTSNPLVPQPPAKRKLGPALGIWSGVTGVGVIGGAVFSLRANNVRQDLDSLCQGTLCPKGAEELLKKDRQAALWADISWSIAAIGLAGTSITLLQGNQLHFAGNQLQWNGTF